MHRLPVPFARSLRRLAVRRLAVLLVAGAALAAAPAHAQKMGFVNQEALLTNMPEYAEARQQLSQELRSQQEEFVSQQQAFQEKLERYQRQRPLLSDSSRTERESELRRLQQELEASAQEREQGLARREMQLLQPLLEKLQTAINDVAERQGVDVVLRASSLVYANPTNVVNLSEAVARDLGIDIGNTDTSPEASMGGSVIGDQ